MESVIATEDEHAAIHPESRGALQPRSEEWRRRTRQAFLAGYRAGIGGCPSFLRNEALFNQLIGVFVLEKTLYEICYETANRSGWVHIPLAGVLGIIDHAK
jgi:maltose alpha-D-glucosyltransferase/alpha-amylase